MNLPDLVMTDCQLPGTRLPFDLFPIIIIIILYRLCDGLENHRYYVYCIDANLDEAHSLAYFFICADNNSSSCQEALKIKLNRVYDYFYLLFFLFFFYAYSASMAPSSFPSPLLHM